MSRRRRATGEFSFRLWLASAGFILLSWPVYGGAQALDSLLGFRFVFLAWALIIMTVWLIDRDNGQGPDDRQEPDE